MKNKSIITQIEVRPREIDALYVDDSWLTNLLKIEEGQLVGTMTEPADGVYRYIERRPRTFNPKDAVPIEKKYVYIWRKGQGKAELIYELAFDSGTFQYINIKSHSGKDLRQSTKTVHNKLILDIYAPDRDSGVVEYDYYFYLAPFQMPWASLQIAEGDLDAACIRLFDPFYTAHFMESPERPRSTKIDSKAANIGYVVYLVDPFKEALRRHGKYIAALEEWNEELAKNGTDQTYLLAKKLDTFLSNKNHQEIREEAVSYDLNSYIKNKEKKAWKLSMYLHDACWQLTSWIGCKERLTPYVASLPEGEQQRFMQELRRPQSASEDEFRRRIAEQEKIKKASYPSSVEHQRAHAMLKALNEDLTRQKRNAAQAREIMSAHTLIRNQNRLYLYLKARGSYTGNAFSAAVDYYKNKKDSWGEVEDIVCIVHGRLNETETGQEWLDKMIASWKTDAASLEGPKREVLFGGSAVFFDGSRSGYQASQKLVAALLVQYAKSWVHKYKEKVTSSLKEWIKATHGIDIHLVEPRPRRRAREKAERNKLNKIQRGLQRAGADELKRWKVLSVLSLNPFGKQIASAARDELRLLAIGLEAVNLANAWDNLDSLVKTL